MSGKRRDAVGGRIRDRIVNGLHVGTLRGGERLASVRTIAAEFDVNPRVVLAALHALADEGIVELRPRSGVYVVPPHPSPEALPHLSAWLITILLQARARGLAPTHVAEFIRRNLETRRVRAACIECNRDQLHLLCSELSAEHGFLTEGVELDDVDKDDPPLAVRRAEVLVTTAFHSGRVRQIAKRLAKPWIGVELSPDVMRGVARYLRSGPVYYIATDPRYERKLRRMLGTIGPTSNLRFVLAQSEDVDAIPRDAPTFVMPSARELLRKRRGFRDGPGIPIQPPPLFFSDASARALLTFLVRANVANAATVAATTRTAAEFAQ